MKPKDADYTIRAFAPPNRGGELLIETWHRGRASRDIEIATFRERMKRGEVSYIDVTSHIDPVGTERIYSTDPGSALQEQPE